MAKTIIFDVESKNHVPFLRGILARSLQDGLFYIRYMDDILFLTQSRWRCRRAVKQLNEAFNELKLEKHPEKTFIGRIEKGSDFLGYHFKSRFHPDIFALLLQVKEYIHL